MKSVRKLFLLTAFLSLCVFQAHAAEVPELEEEMRVVGAAVVSPDELAEQLADVGVNQRFAAGNATPLSVAMTETPLNSEDLWTTLAILAVEGTKERNN